MIISATKAPHLPLRMKNLSKLDDKTTQGELRVYDGVN